MKEDSAFCIKVDGKRNHTFKGSDYSKVLRALAELSRSVDARSCLSSVFTCPLENEAVLLERKKSKCNLNVSKTQFRNDKLYCQKNRVPPETLGQKLKVITLIFMEHMFTKIIILRLAMKMFDFAKIATLTLKIRLVY
ncbi:hypothetical protein WN944_026401 [Citrus x changshan-huyou]|uniref:Uncharacterized protein n=1 Tax=Citrus x changshan-huyou TaxID=2935761 RepID=A0AAP0LV10_9ROSI